MAGADSANDQLISIRCMQGWKGVVTLPRSATLADFQVALGAASGLAEADVLSMIIKGRRHNPAVIDRTTFLSTLGVTSSNCPVMLVVRSSEQRAAIQAQEERLHRLQELERVAATLSARLGGVGADRNDYELSICTQ